MTHARQACCWCGVGTANSSVWHVRLLMRAACCGRRSLLLGCWCWTGSLTGSLCTAGAHRVSCRCRCLFAWMGGRVAGCIVRQQLQVQCTAWLPRHCRQLRVVLDMCLSSASQTHAAAGAAISLAAACGSHVVVACGSSLTCLSVSCCSGALQQVAGCELRQQASALALLSLTGEPAAGGKRPAGRLGEACRGREWRPTHWQFHPLTVIIRLSQR